MKSNWVIKTTPLYYELSKSVLINFAQYSFNDAIKDLFKHANTVSSRKQEPISYSPGPLLIILFKISLNMLIQLVPNNMNRFHIHPALWSL